MKGKLMILLSALLLVSMVSIVPVSAASTLTLSTSSKDATISAFGLADYNLGADYGLEVESVPSISSLQRFLVQFNLPPELSGATIMSATLTLDWVSFLSGSNPNDVDLRVCRVIHDWTEGTGEWGALTQDGVTWNEYDYYDGLTTAANNWGTPGGDYTEADSIMVSTSQGADTVWTVTDIVQGWASATYPNHGFLIKLDNESPTEPQGFTFGSKEHGSSYFPPILEITYLPATEGVSEQIDTYVTEDSIDNKGIANGLSKLLANAQAKIDQGKVNAAVNQLKAFIKTVQAQMGKHITVAAAQALIASVQAIIDAL